jgi:pimeloyl-ACP methyl ester carboxylesterase
MISHTTAVNNISLHHWTHGVGKPLLLLHDFLDLSLSYFPLMNELGKHRINTVAVDLRGYGKSSKPPAVDDYSVAKICRDIFKLLDSIDFENSTILGHGFGAHIAWNMALFYPESFSKIISLGMPYLPYTQGSSVLEAFANDPKKTFQFWTDAQVGGGLEERYQASPDGVIQNRFQENTYTKVVPQGIDIAKHSQMLSQSALLPFYSLRNLRADWTEHVTLRGKKVEHQSLLIAPQCENFQIGGIVTGQESWLLEEWKKGALYWAPNLRIENLDGCGYWPQLEATNKLVPIILDFLK